MSFPEVTGVVRKESGERPRDLSRTEMREEFLAEGGALGKVYHVGSDPTPDPLTGLKGVVFPEVVASGFCSWLQGPGELQDMRVQPYHHPDIGLIFNPASGKVELIENRTDEFLAAITSDAGIDFHPDAAPGWHTLAEAIEEVGYLGKGTVLKTHIASLRCCQGALSPEAAQYQGVIAAALAREHLGRAKALAEKVIVSLDDPDFNFAGLMESVEALGGAQVMVALHSCGAVEGLPVMRSGKFDVIHFDAWLYDLSPVMGDPELLRAYLESGGMLAIGGIPQNLKNLPVLAHRLGVPEAILAAAESKGNFLPMAGFLVEQSENATEFMFSKYRLWVQKLAEATGLDPQQVARQVFVSATCGYGPNPNPILRRFSYTLARNVADRIVAEYGR